MPINLSGKTLPKDDIYAKSIIIDEVLSKMDLNVLMFDDMFDTLSSKDEIRNKKNDENTQKTLFIVGVANLNNNNQIQHAPYENDEEFTQTLIQKRNEHSPSNDKKITSDDGDDGGDDDPSKNSKNVDKWKKKSKKRNREPSQEAEEENTEDIMPNKSQKSKHKQTPTSRLNKKNNKKRKRDEENDEFERKSSKKKKSDDNKKKRKRKEGEDRESVKKQKINNVDETNNENHPIVKNKRRSNPNIHINKVKKNNKRGRSEESDDLCEGFSRITLKGKKVSTENHFKFSKTL